MNTLKQFFEGVLDVNSGYNIINTVAAVIVAVILGVIIYLTYKLTCRAFMFDEEVGLVLIIVPVVVALLLSVIGTSIARAFSLAGALSIVRYRSVMMSPRSVVYIFFGMGAGFVTGVGLYIPALIFVLLTCAVMVVHGVITSGKKGTVARKTLVVDIPESINYDGLLDETLSKYTDGYNLDSVGIVSGGTVTELVYQVKLKKDADTKALLDDLRVLNGNFKILLSQFRPVTQ
ncbi:MAG: DUF4956 domain-containing protein [Clostridia bacterium]|jgi:hypothetical protein|nr:DUF4956 domain-containing protein [Clostridia bacterium]